jgi:hypothetical protein
MSMTATMLAFLFTCGDVQPPLLPPLTVEQRERIGKLAAETQREAARLKDQLEKRQSDLTRLYAQYELDENAANAVEADILDLQKQLLSNYRKMQMELRALVGKDRFTVLKKRLDRMLDSPNRVEPKSESPKRPIPNSQSNSERPNP